MGDGVQDWSLAAALLGAGVAVLMLVHRVVSQLLVRIDALGHSLTGEMQRRFDESEHHRQETDRLWQERLAHRDLAIADLRRDYEVMRQELLERYVQRDHYLESEGRTMIMLDKIRACLARINGGCAGGQCERT
jgi:hypothetical protein